MMPAPNSSCLAGRRHTPACSRSARTLIWNKPIWSRIDRADIHQDSSQRPSACCTGRPPHPAQIARNCPTLRLCIAGPFRACRIASGCSLTSISRRAKIRSDAYLVNVVAPQGTRGAASVARASEAVRSARDLLAASKFGFLSECEGQDNPPNFAQAPCSVGGAVPSMKVRARSDEPARDG